MTNFAKLLVPTVMLFALGLCQSAASADADPNVPHDDQELVGDDELEELLANPESNAQELIRDQKLVSKGYDYYGEIKRNTVGTIVITKGGGVALLNRSGKVPKVSCFRCTRKDEKKLGRKCHKSPTRVCKKADMDFRSHKNALANAVILPNRSGSCTTVTSKGSSYLYRLCR